MRSRFLRGAAVAAWVLRAVVSQNSVPQDLKAGFASSGKELQVSYTGNAVEGFQDGTTFEKDQVAKEPTFALGDASGISSTTLFTVIMIDTTNDNSRTLHYARANFKYNFDITNIETQDQALLEYKAPGAFGETGDSRKYTFLMYTNPARKQITQLKLPAEGETFDVKQFQSDNGLSDASAGIGMTVKVGGQSNPSSSSAPASSSSAASSSASVGSSSSAISATSATTATTTQASSTTSSSTKAISQNASSTSDQATGAATDASTVRQSSAATRSASTVLTSVQPSATGSSTTSATAAQSTGAASSLSAKVPHCVMVGSMVAIVGMLAWV